MTEKTEKPRILQESTFTVEEGLSLRGMKVGAVWLHKLFVSSVVLVAVWVALAALGRVEGPYVAVTSKYLALAAVVSFVLYALLRTKVGFQVKDPDKSPVGFTVREGPAYRAMRTGAIWMNKLFFSSLILLVIWLFFAAFSGTSGCVDRIESVNGTVIRSVEQCGAFLTTTSIFLSSMALLTFGLSLLFGVLGLVVGKKILESTPAAEEVGAGTSVETHPKH